MKILFQTIGVLVHYNFALPHYLTRMKEVEKVYLLAGIFPITMGGHYYIAKSIGKLKIILYKSGICLIDEHGHINTFKNYILKHIVMKYHDYNIIQLNTTESFDVFTRMKASKLFVLHGSPDNVNERGCRALENVYANVDAFVVVSFHAAQMLRNRCGFEPTHVIHHGVDMELFNPLAYSKVHARKSLGLPLDKKIILWNARLSSEKKIETLLYALPYVIREVKDVLVVIKTRAVVKDYEAKVKEIIDRLNLGRYIIFDKDWTPLNNMPMYYRAADTYVNTSTTEAFGSLTMLEAMACGVPTIANNASSNPEALGDGGLLYDRNNAADLAEKVLKVLTDEKHAKLLGYKAFKRVLNELTLHNTARKYLSLYSSL
jgi:glycosyltransferase involved in cell wall biosynthesis